MAYIVTTATGFPEHYYPQEVLATALKKYLLAMDLDFDLETIDRFFTNVKIKGRYFTFPLDSFYDPPGIEEVANTAITQCLNVIENTVIKLLEQAAIAPQDISQLTATTLIAATPGLDARLINRIPFAPDIKRMSLTGV
ncbi:MAG: type III polyketide synthase, partial [Waterburya sp.]